MTARPGSFRRSLAGLSLLGSLLLAGGTSAAALPAPACTGCPAASFGPAPRVFRAAAETVIAGDFNGDGIPDFARADKSTGGSVSVYPGMGTGDFGAPITTPGDGYWVSGFFSADLDRDGFPEVLRFGGLGLWVQLGRGDGSFGPPITYRAVGSIDLATGDFNGDGWPDVALAATVPNRVSILFGGPGGTLTPGPDLNLTGTPVAIVSGVLRPGGKLDLAVAQTSPDSVVTFLGAGNGTFSAGSTLALPSGPSAIAVGDLDGDHAQDLAVGFRNSYLQAFQGNSDGSFTPRVTLPVYGYDRIRIADLDGDGRADLAFLDYTGLGVRFGTGSWTFEARTVSRPGSTAIDFDLADFDGDGRLDAAVLNGPGLITYVTILRGIPEGFEIAPTSPSVLQGFTVLKGDFNGDGRPDLAVAPADYPFGYPVAILFGDGDGGLGVPVTVTGTSSPTAVAVEDLNRDGRADLIVYQQFTLLVYHGSASGPPVLHQSINGTFPSFAVADFNGDGRPDLAYPSAQGVMILPGDGAGGFGAGVLALTVPNNISIHAGDFNGDGKEDLLVGQYLALGQGNGSFQPPVTVTLPSPPNVIGDVDGDGKDDVVGVMSGETVGIGFSTGSGFLEPVKTSISTSSSAARLADVNGDGLPDLVMTYYLDDIVSVYVSHGDGTFSAGTSYRVGREPRSAEVLDLDGDGRPEIVVPSRYDQTVSVLFNTRCVPRRLNVSTPASGCSVPGSPLATQPVVRITDDGGNVVACEGALVTASIAPGSGTPGAVLGGSTSVAAANGVAAFTDLSIDRAGGGYQFDFQSPALVPARSPRFRVGDPPAPPFAGSNSPVCLGRPLQLTASAVLGARYDWTGPNGFHSIERNPVIPDPSPAAAGVYNVVMSLDGCPAAAATTSVTVNPIPEIKMTAPASACPNGRGLTASVAHLEGASYAWTVTNGTITSGQGTESVTFTAGMSGSVGIAVTVTGANGCSSTASKSVPILSAGCGRSFFTVAPCRAVDTRLAAGSWGGPWLAAGAVRSFSLGNRCGVPYSAKAVAANLTVIGPSNDGDLRVYPPGPAPLASSINFRGGVTRANNAIIPLFDGYLSVQCDMPSGGTHFVLDVYGYFE